MSSSNGGTVLKSIVDRIRRLGRLEKNILESEVVLDINPAEASRELTKVLKISGFMIKDGAFVYKKGQISNELLELVHNYSPDNVSLTTSRVMVASGSDVTDGGKKKKRRGIGKNKRSKNIETDPLL